MVSWEIVGLEKVKSPGTHSPWSLGPLSYLWPQFPSLPSGRGEPLVWMEEGSVLSALPIHPCFIH